MPMNGFNVGRDVKVDVVGNTGALVSFNKVTMFDSKQVTQSIKIVGLDGVVNDLELPHGWTGGIEVERMDAAVDDYIASLESAYYNGVNIQGGRITETITEVNGGQSQYRYDGVMFKLDDAGSKKGDASIKQKLSWVAARRIKVV